MAAAVLLEDLGWQSQKVAKCLKETSHQKYLPHHRQKVAKWLHQYCLKTSDGRPKCPALMYVARDKPLKEPSASPLERWPRAKWLQQCCLQTWDGKPVAQH